MEIMMLKSCLGQLEESLNELSVQVPQSPALFAAQTPGVFLAGAEGISIIQHGITDLYYEDGTVDGRFTPICLGAVAVDPDLIKLIKRVNNDKDQFHLACRRVLEHATSTRNELLSAAGRAKRLRTILCDVGYARLSLRQCYRHIPLLEQSPYSIRFSYSSGGRSIRRLTVAQAVALIDKAGMESEKSDIDKERLVALPPDTILAQVQPLAGYYKANVFQNLKEDPITIAAFLPIFYPYDPSRTVISQPRLPESVPGLITGRKVRSDKKLEDEPFASSIRVYAYKPVKRP